MYIFPNIDFDIFKNLEPLLIKPLVICHENDIIDKQLSIGFIACSKNNKQMKKCIDNIKTIDFSLAVDEATGPYYFRKNIDISSNDVYIVPTNYLYPIKWTNSKKELNTITTKHTSRHRSFVLFSNCTATIGAILGL